MPRCAFPQPPHSQVAPREGPQKPGAIPAPAPLPSRDTAAKPRCPQPRFAFGAGLSRCTRRSRRRKAGSGRSRHGSRLWEAAAAQGRPGVVGLAAARPDRFFSSSGYRISSDGKPAKFQPPPKPVIIAKQKQREERRFLSPEFIPPRGRKDPLKFFIERKDMIQRRKVFNIPEFYVGSILAVTTADPFANDKINRFVGICIQRGGKGLGATFVLRNVIEDQGIEIRYELYNPRIQAIEVLKLEKRLDENLMYLRDALPEYSTVDVNMKPVAHLEHEEIPVNTLQVRMKPKPWSKRWERPKYNIKGIKFELPEEKMRKAQKWSQPWLEFDMLREYDTSKIEEKIWKEVNEELKK